MAFQTNKIQQEKDQDAIGKMQCTNKKAIKPGLQISESVNYC